MTYKYDEGFMWWFEEVYGEEQAKILDELAKEQDKDVMDCVNNECACDYFKAEHNQNYWTAVDEKDRESWRIKP